MIALLATFLVAALAVGYVAAPLVRRQAPACDADASAGDAFAERQEETYAALRDLAHEYEVGHLESDDYFAMRDRYARRAMALLKLADERDRQADAAVEEAVRTLRGSSAGADAAPARCPRCGAPVPGRPQTCPVCGAGLEHGAGGARRAGRWVAPLAAAVAVIVAATAGVTTLVRTQQETQRPVATLPSQAVRGVIFSPSARGALLLATPDTLLQSTDTGKSWRQLRTGGTLFALAGAGTPGSSEARIWIADRDSVLQSTDGGRTFAKAGTPSPGQDVRALSPGASNPRELLALTADGALSRSEDAGATWSAAAAAEGQPALPPDVGSIAAVAGDPAVVFAASPSGGVFATYDQGTTWAAANGFVNGLLPTRDVRQLVYDPASGDRFVQPNGAVLHGALYAATDAGVWKSIDQGGSWQQLSLKVPVVALAVNPADSTELAAVDAQGQLFVSRDRGVRWDG